MEKITKNSFGFGAMLNLPFDALLIGNNTIDKNRMSIYIYKSIHLKFDFIISISYTPYSVNEKLTGLSDY